MPEENQNPTEPPETVNAEEQPERPQDVPLPYTNGDVQSSRAVDPQFIAGSGLVPALDELPPEAQGEVNGGPLGCCLGVFIGLMVSLPIAVFGRLYANPLIPVFHSALLVLILLRIAMAIGAIAGMVILGYFGWKIGKKLYREYEPPVIHYRERKRPKRKVVQKKV